MEQKDIFSGLSVEKILADVKEMEGKQPLKLWSLADVDALLAEEDNEKNTPPSQAQKAAPEKEEPKKEEFVVLEKKAEFNAPAETQSAAAETKQESTTEEAAPVLSDSVKHAARVLEHLRAMEAEQKEQPEVKKESAAPAEEKKEIEEAELSPEPLLSGVTVQDEEEEPPAEEAPEEANPLPGQISLEKTRVFNEVQSRAVHNPDIEHHIGQKVIRTGAEAPKKPAMERDRYRERFLNRPEQKLEKTMEHKKLLEQLPPKTIEKPGVIVRKDAQEATGEDGLQAIPKLITPEDVLKEEQEQTKVQVQEGSLKSHAFEHPVDEAAEATPDDQVMFEGFGEEEPVEQIDEQEAEMDLFERRREKAKRFRLFPGLNAAEEETDEDVSSEDEEEAEETPTADEKTRVRLDLPDEAEEDELEEAFEDDETEEEETGRRGRRKRTRVRQMPPVRVLREFFGPKDTRGVYDIFRAELRGYRVRTVVLSILTVASVLSAFLVRLTESFDFVGGNAGVYAAVNLIFLLAAGLMSLKPLKTAALGIFHRYAAAETGLLCVLIFALLQIGVSFAFSQQAAEVPLYSAVGLLSFAMYYSGRANKQKADIADFHLLAQHYNHFHSIGKIEDEEVAFEIGRGLLLGDPDIRYSKPVKLPSHFVEITKKSDPANEIYARAIPAVLIAAGVIGAVTGFVTQSVYIGISAMTAVVLAGMPSAALLSSASGFAGVNKGLRAQGAMISGFDAAFDTLSANAIVIDAADLFQVSDCRLCGMKLYHKMRVDEALLYTAAMVIQSGGTLSSLFDGVIQSRRDILPQVESLAYEERLGCSGWIYNQRVLVGSRELLVKHNVDAPSREEERIFKKDGCEVLYLAVEGKTAALFVVSYAAAAQTADYLCRLEKYGISILVRTSDPNITEGLVEQIFHLPHNLVKIINPVAGDLFRDLVKQPPKDEPCGIIHDGRTESGLRAMLGAFILDEKFRLTEILSYIGVGLNVLLLAVLSFFSGLAQAGTLEVVVFELVWMAIMMLLPKIKKI